MSDAAKPLVLDMLELTISDGAQTIPILKRYAQILRYIANKRAVYTETMDEVLFKHCSAPQNTRRTTLWRLNALLARLGMRAEYIGHGHAIRLRNPVTIKEGEDE